MYQVGFLDTANILFRCIYQTIYESIAIFQYDNPICWWCIHHVLKEISKFVAMKIISSWFMNPVPVIQWILVKIWTHSNRLIWQKIFEGLGPIFLAGANLLAYVINTSWVDRWHTFGSWKLFFKFCYPFLGCLCSWNCISGGGLTLF